MTTLTASAAFKDKIKKEKNWEAYKVKNGWNSFGAFRVAFIIPAFQKLDLAAQKRNASPESLARWNASSGGKVKNKIAGIVKQGKGKYHFSRTGKKTYYRPIGYPSPTGKQLVNTPWVKKSCPPAALPLWEKRLKRRAAYDKKKGRTSIYQKIGPSWLSQNCKGGKADYLKMRKDALKAARAGGYGYAGGCGCAQCQTVGGCNCSRCPPDF